MKPLVECYVRKLCEARGFKKRTVTANVRRLADRDILIDCYRQWPTDPGGQHYLDIKANIHSLLPGLSDTAPLKPSRYMLFARIENSTLTPSKHSLGQVLDDNAMMSEVSREADLDHVFRNIVDPFVRTLEANEAIKQHHKEGMTPGLHAMGPGLVLFGGSSDADWRNFLR